MKYFTIITIAQYGLVWVASLIALVEWDRPGIGHASFRFLTFPYWSFQDFPEYWPVFGIFNSMLWAIIIVGCHYALRIIQHKTTSRFLSKRLAAATLIALLLLPFCVALSMTTVSRAVSSAPFDRTNTTTLTNGELKTLVEQAGRYDINYRGSDDDYHYFHRVELRGGASYRVSLSDFNVRHTWPVDEPASTGVYSHWFDDEPSGH